MQNGVIPTMSETACALNIPERTLRHQLQQLQTSYKEIRERLIKQKAIKFIENSAYSSSRLQKCWDIQSQQPLIMHLNDGLDEVLDNIIEKTKCLKMVHYDV
jgi:hypothetical protein